jgi:putative DNA primase/helicase
VSDRRFDVKQYLDEGFGRPHPIPRGEKGPRIPGWQNPEKKFGTETFGPDDNVGTSLVGDLVDVDCDCDEAVKAAATLLLRTRRVHGRPSRRASHYWYRAEGVESKQFRDTKPNRQMLVELRAGSKHQTVLPPSQHPSGEVLDWEPDCRQPPAPVDGEGLTQAVRLVATVALVVRHWPKNERHNLLLALAGFFERVGVDKSQCREALEEITLQAENEAWQDCRAVTDSTYAKTAEAKTTGAPTIEKILGEEVVTLLRTWFNTGDALLLDPKDPRPSARKLVEQDFTVDGFVALRHQAGVFYGFLPATSTYAEVDTATIRARIYTFLESAKRATETKKGEIVAFQPNTSKVNNVLDALQALVNLPTSAHAPCWLEPNTEFDPSDLLPCLNGVLHLPTRRLLPATPKLFALNGADVAFTPDAPAPEAWLRFLDSVWSKDPDCVSTLQEIAGYLLTPDTRFEKIFLLVGPRRSGKGTVARVLGQLVGDRNACAPTLTSLGGPFGKQPLIGKTVGLIADARLSGRTDPAVVAETLLSISGRDAQGVPRKNLEDWRGRLGVRFVVFANELPKVVDASGALVSRFIVLPMTESFYGREDLALSDRLAKELPSILNWALAGRDRLLERGYFLQPQSAKALIETFEDLASPENAFVRDECEVKEGVEVEAMVLFDAWQDWCRENGRDHPGTAQTFGRALRAVLPSVVTKQHRGSEGRQRFFVGVGVRAPEGARREPAQEEVPF